MRIRALLVQGFGVSDLHLRELESTDIEGTDRVAVNATLTSEKRREIALEYIVGRLSLEPSVTAARWRAVTRLFDAPAESPAVRLEGAHRTFCSNS